MLKDWQLSNRCKSVLVICYGSFILIGVIVQSALGSVIIPQKGHRGPPVSLAEGWPWLIAEVALGAALIWKGAHGVKTDSWPPP